MLNEFSNYSIASKNAISYLGHDAVLYPSTRKNMKFMIENPYTGKFVHFGRLGYFDYTKHKDEQRIINYLKRATKIKGKWKDDPYSPNNLSIHILWN